MKDKNTDSINVKDKNTNPHNNSNYDIVLVCVLVGKLYNSNEHLGIGSIASVLRKSGYSVKVLYIHESEVDEYITGEVLSNNPKIIGFNTYAITILKVTNIATLIKSKNSSVKIFLGGPTATFEDREILSKCEAVDFIIRGEGEFTVVEAVDAVFKNLSFDNIKGLSYKAKDNIIVNPNRKSIDDLDALPWPDRDFCEGKKPDYLIIETARGCLGRCSFCSAANKSLYGGKVWRGRSVKNVIDEIEHLVKTYDVRAFNIIDASFEDPGMKGKKRIESFAKEIIDRNLEITYMAHFRSENIKEKDNYLLDLLIQSGLERVSLGLESGYSLGLKVFNKRATVEDNEEIVKILRNKHLALVSGFIMFQPYSSIEELRENTNFLRKTGFACRFENFEQHIEIYPGTPLKETMIKDGLITDKHDFTYRNYEYEYVDGRILPLARAMGNIANEYNIEFELFDLSMQIFCLRVRKKLSSQDEINKLNKFERELNKMREGLSDNICDFFLNQVDDIEKGKWKEDNFRNLIDGGIVKPTIHTKHKIRRLQKNYMKDLLSKSNFDFKKI
ncbi:MAG: B12-binding domain-containing radical SAM protein [Clostridia bacterium]|nr:B12-binding domain-containing radical SAM protein [Clostridia bacterium]